MAHNIKSHIQMPKRVLINFEKGNNGFARFDVKENKIEMFCHAASTNIEKGYYDESIEELLNKYFEKPFLDLLNRIKKIDINNINWTTNNTNNKIIIDFCISLLFRNPKLHNLIPSDFFCSEEDKKDLMIVLGCKVKDESCLNNYFATLSFNKTPIPFVLPVGGLVAIPYANEEERILFPVAPHIAITLISQKHVDDYRSNGEIIGFEYNDSEFIKYFNELAFKTQCQDEWGYVVCPKKEELDRLKSWWDNEKNERQRN